MKKNNPTVSESSKSCHQCRRFKRNSISAGCTSQWKGKACPLVYCRACLKNRYEKTVEEIRGLDNWTCPRCEGNCDCSQCNKREVCEPIGQVNAKRQATGMSCLSETGIEIIPEDAVGQVQHQTYKVEKNTHQLETVCGGAESSCKKKSCHQCRHYKAGSVQCTNQIKEKICPLMYCGSCLKNRYGKEVKEIRGLDKWTCPRCEGDCDCSECMKRIGREPVGYVTAKRQATGVSSVSDTQIELLPLDAIEQEQELTSVVGIDMATKHVGKALQFLEFCACFGEILGLKKGEPECVLQSLLDDKAKIEGEPSAAAKFQMHLLQIIQEDPENKRARSLSKGKSGILWFDMLKRFLAESQSVLEALGLDSLDEKTEFQALDSSEKLTIVNVLCDQVLETKKVRKCIGGQIRKIAGKDKDTSDDNAVILGTNTLRTEPFYKQKGYVFWKLNALAESDILLCQNVGKGDGLTLDEKWTSVNAESKEAIEKHISLSREEKKKRKRTSRKEVVPEQLEETEQAL